ncbi:MAG: hypothetical protein FWF44_08555, partial [Defluviitaleaceae bacterium]|nr:hypothetical protein [Defluviitaleaceae bacterium]
MANNMFNVIDHGAAADGKTDCTAAFQKALDEAGKVSGAVIVPPGEYLCGQLIMRPYTSIEGYPAWGYFKQGGSVIKLNAAGSKCLLDITGAKGVTIKGLCLEGGELGVGVHGIMADKADFDGGEDTVRIEDCRVAHFTGDGVHLFKIWVFSIRHSMIGFNHGSGLYFTGWDGFLLDNWFSGNKGCGIFGDAPNASIMVTANRVEWN